MIIPLFIENAYGTTLAKAELEYSVAKQNFEKISNAIDKCIEILQNTPDTTENYLKKIKTTDIAIRATDNLEPAEKEKNIKYRQLTKVIEETKESRMFLATLTIVSIVTLSIASYWMQKA